MWQVQFKGFDEDESWWEAYDNRYETEEEAYVNLARRTFNSPDFMRRVIYLEE